jgi:hypothetical protein
MPERNAGDIDVSGYLYVGRYRGIDGSTYRDIETSKCRYIAILRYVIPRYLDMSRYLDTLDVVMSEHIDISDSRLHPWPRHFWLYHD